MKDCENVGPTVCSTEYESECVTTQERHEVPNMIAEICKMLYFIDKHSQLFISGI